MLPSSTRLTELNRRRPEVHVILTAREDAVGAEQDSVGLVVVLPIVGVAHPGRKTLFGGNMRAERGLHGLEASKTPNPHTSRSRPVTDRFGSAFLP